jgi:hypothetical protein
VTAIEAGDTRNFVRISHRYFESCSAAAADLGRAPAPVRVWAEAVAKLPWPIEAGVCDLYASFTNVGGAGHMLGARFADLMLERASCAGDAEAGSIVEAFRKQNFKGGVRTCIPRDWYAYGTLCALLTGCAPLFFWASSALDTYEIGHVLQLLCLLGRTPHAKLRRVWSQLADSAMTLLRHD